MTKRKLLKDLIILYRELWQECKDKYLDVEHDGNTKLEAWRNGYYLGSAFAYSEACEKLYEIIRKYDGRCFY